MLSVAQKLPLSHDKHKAQHEEDQKMEMNWQKIHQGKHEGQTIWGLSEANTKTAVRSTHSNLGSAEETAFIPTPTS